VNPIAIIKKYYAPESRAFHLLIHHSRMVTEKALRIAGRVAYLSPDLSFIQEAAMLHDIGIFLTREPALGCCGEKAYICHGFLGRELLEREGFSQHALVCERHVGVGISLRDIEKMNLPLPARDMLPLTIEEQIICYADKFFSKDAESLLKEKSLEKIRSGIAGFGEDKLKRFDEWLTMFGDY
jgi:uncharacterized protein